VIAAFAVVILVGALSCPLLAWWARRRGYGPCCSPARIGRGAAVAEGQRRLAERVRAVTFAPFACQAWRGGLGR